MEFIVTTYTVLSVDGETYQQPFLSTADEVRRALAERLGDMVTDAELARIYTTARARDAIAYVKPYGFRFADYFEPLDHLVTLTYSREAAEFRVWLLNNLRTIVDRPELLDARMFNAWLSDADEHGGFVEISGHWSVSGAPVTFNVWEAA